MPLSHAMRYRSHGAPEQVLRLEQVELPAPRPREVQVAVAAAGVSGGEIPIIDGRLRRLVRTRLPAGVGNDFTGRVTGVGAEVHTLSVGDEVWGTLPRGKFGSVAEHVTVPEGRVAPAPQGVDLVLAAALPVAGTTAMRALQDVTRLRPGERLLVRGAGGGTGVALVQLGKELGAHVTALASARALDALATLGADETVDYRAVPLDRLGTFDVVVDLVGTRLADVLARLAPGGRMASLAVDASRPLRAIGGITAASLRTRGRAAPFSNNPSPAKLRELTALAQSGVLRPVVDRQHPLADAATAYAMVAAGGTCGKVLVRMAS